MPDTKTHYWREAGLAGQIDAGKTRRGRRDAILVLPLIVAVLVIYNFRRDLFGNDIAVRVVAVVILVVLGWIFARAIGRALRPWLYRRLDPGTAGTVGFLIRLGAIGLALLIALRVAGLRPETLAVGGAVTAVVIGLAAQQTIGNVFAGMLLLSARPFRVGERVRMHGGMVAGEIEGVVSSLGLLYTTLNNGDDEIMVPNNVVLNLAIVPLREPDAVDLRARLPLGTRPSEVQQMIEEGVAIRLRTPPKILLEEVDDDETVVRVTAAPLLSTEGSKLTDEILAVLARVTRKAGGDGDRDRGDGAARDEDRSRDSARYELG
jgi:small-conductance mechanosensitive channel